MHLSSSLRLSCLSLSLLWFSLGCDDDPSNTTTSGGERWRDGR